MRAKASDPSNHWLVAKYKIDVMRSGSATHPPFTDATVSFNDPACGEQACFMVSGTGDFAELPSGNDEFTAYVEQHKTPDNIAKEDQTWGSSFLPESSL